MLLFLLPDGKAESVKRIFDYLERGLGIERFQRLFRVFLTDNGSEFKRADELELTEDYEYRTRIFYCDPMASWQKPHIEKNHEFIRYVIPRGKSFTPYTHEDMTLLMNHINSTKRPGLNGKAPYELINEEDEDMWALFELLKIGILSIVFLASISCTILITVLQKATPTNKLFLKASQNFKSGKIIPLNKTTCFCSV